jgi:iron complex transport system permease protein
MRQYPRWLWPVCILLLAFLFGISVSLGTVRLSMDELFSVLMGAPNEMLHHTIVVQSRIPRAIAAMLGGAALSLAGLFMQTLFRNPLAGPSVMGLTSGASLAVAIVALGGTGLAFSTYGSIGAATLGSFAVLAIILLVARRFADITAVLIVGLMLSFFASSIVGFLQSIASETALKSYVFWGFGSFANVSLARLPVFIIPILAVMGLSPFLIKPLNALMLGELHAQSMGMGIRKLRLFTMGSTGILTGVVTAFCGPIAFIGLAAPHIARLVFGTVDHRIVLPASLLMGGALGLVCDTISRLPGLPQSLPLNTVCAFMGAPVVIYLIFAGRKKKIVL